LAQTPIGVSGADVEREQYVGVIVETERGWAIRSAGGESVVDDPRSAAGAVRELNGLERGGEDADVRLVDSSGQQVFGFVLLFTGGETEPEQAAGHRRVADEPPEGCRPIDWGGGYQGLFCVRPGSSRFAAVAGLVALLRDLYGVTDANDMAFEKLWEWSGDVEHRQDLVAHLVLMAAYRARQCGIDAAELAALAYAARGVDVSGG
jgi:hypothetical protein